MLCNSYEYKSVPLDHRERREKERMDKERIEKEGERVRQKVQTTLQLHFSYNLIPFFPGSILSTFHDRLIMNAKSSELNGMEINEFDINILDKIFTQ